ncbi:hypothetical protein BY996DRAFT_6469068 [Phakopsora pachyrhizi]|nr:hypothetical protein BY996DRAFT_6469068 [Phakopsora pachyrhizi]
MVHGVSTTIVENLHVARRVHQEISTKAVKQIGSKVVKTIHCQVEMAGLQWVDTPKVVRLNYNLNVHERVRAFSILKLSQDRIRGLGPVGKRVPNTVAQPEAQLPPYICQEVTNWTVEDYLEQIEIGDRGYHSNKEPRADKQDPGEPRANAMIKENGGETKLPCWHMRSALPNDCGCKIQVGGNRRPAMQDVHKRSIQLKLPTGQGKHLGINQHRGISLGKIRFGQTHLKDQASKPKKKKTTIWRNKRSANQQQCK